MEVELLGGSADYRKAERLTIRWSNPANRIPRLTGIRVDDIQAPSAPAGSGGGPATGPGRLGRRFGSGRCLDPELIWEERTVNQFQNKFLVKVFRSMYRPTSQFPIASPDDMETFMSAARENKMFRSAHGRDISRSECRAVRHHPRQHISVIDDSSALRRAASIQAKASKHWTASRGTVDERTFHPWTATMILHGKNDRPTSYTIFSDCRSASYISVSRPVREKLGLDRTCSRRCRLALLGQSSRWTGLGAPNNLNTQIGLILMIALSAKNAF